MGLYVAISIWLIANIGMGFWLFSASSGWLETKRLPYTRRLRLAYFGERGAGITDTENPESIRKFVRRFRVYFYFVFLMPLIVFYGALYVVYTT